jgi:hypothetical protein
MVWGIVGVAAMVTLAKAKAMRPGALIVPSKPLTVNAVIDLPDLLPNYC